MTDRKTSLSSRDTPPSEPPYECESLSDSDGEFLAELDLVLASDSVLESAATSSEAAARVLEGDASVAEKRSFGDVDRGKAQAANDEASENVRIAGSAPWLGAIALLGAFGVGVGGVGLWRVVDLEDRLNRIEPVSRVTAAPVVDTVSAENTRRIDDLEQRLGASVERMQADLGALSESLAEKLDGHNERLDGDLAALNATLSALHEQLLSAQALMTETGTMGSQPANSLIVPETSSAQSAPDPEPAAEGAVASVESVSTAGEKTNQWSVNLFAADRQDKTEEELTRFQAQDVPAEILSVVSKGKVWYRIAVRGFDSFEKASVYAETLRSKPGMSGVWVGRN